MYRIPVWPCFLDYEKNFCGLSCPVTRTPFSSVYTQGTSSVGVQGTQYILFELEIPRQSKTKGVFSSFHHFSA